MSGEAPSPALSISVSTDLRGFGTVHLMYEPSPSCGRSRPSEMCLCMHAFVTALHACIAKRVTCQGCQGHFSATIVCLGAISTRTPSRWPCHRQQWHGSRHCRGRGSSALPPTIRRRSHHCRGSALPATCRTCQSCHRVSIKLHPCYGQQTALPARTFGQRPAQEA